MKHLLLAAFDGAYYIIDAKKQLIYTVNQSAYAEIAAYMQLPTDARAGHTLSTATQTIIEATS